MVRPHLHHPPRLLLLGALLLLLLPLALPLSAARMPYCKGDPVTSLCDQLVRINITVPEPFTGRLL